MFYSQTANALSWNLSWTDAAREAAAAARHAGAKAHDTNTEEEHKNAAQAFRKSAAAHMESAKKSFQAGDREGAANLRDEAFSHEKLANDHEERAENAKGVPLPAGHRRVFHSSPDKIDTLKKGSYVTPDRSISKTFGGDKSIREGKGEAPKFFLHEFHVKHDDTERTRTPAGEDWENNKTTKDLKPVSVKEIHQGKP